MQQFMVNFVLAAVVASHPRPVAVQGMFCIGHGRYLKITRGGDVGFEMVGGTLYVADSSGFCLRFERWAS